VVSDSQPWSVEAEWPNGTMEQVNTIKGYFEATSWPTPPGQNLSTDCDDAQTAQWQKQSSFGFGATISLPPTPWGGWFSLRPALAISGPKSRSAP